MSGVVTDGGTFFPSQWSSPDRVTEEVQQLCEQYREGVEKVYNGGNRFQQFTPTYFMMLTKKDEYKITRIKVWINPIAQIRLQFKQFTPITNAPIVLLPEVTAYCDGSLEEGPPEH
ncbi:uncharacterized protein LOC135823631 [Sycon ciliatum]|uniref:uncharacterized protein LOC135823631 n=1 Tax=Sycon ciliatum TaxID=27933 RepID=UPI0020AA0147|eukprot:scpid100086/ scgid8720/ 